MSDPVPTGGTGPRIRILPDHVANQIAAGEVVERPASVVKELVENALDAGAKRIDVELRNGGKTWIRVADDGEGMERADALLALDRHATSKIREVADLRSVASFGFRGEALSSIAAVSRFELQTAPDGGGIGTQVRVEGGRIVSVSEIARRRGTTVTVRSLFQNVPARSKFLRSAAAETRAASEALILLALGNLHASFRIASNDRELLDLPPAADIGARVRELWGTDEAGELLALDEETAGIRIAGLIQRPDAARPAGGRRYLFVNGRPFRDPGLVRELDDAYRTTVAPGLRPSAFLYLAIPAGGVDVNVHPAKAEVRFSDPKLVRDAVREAVRSRLGGLTSAPGFGPEAGPAFETGTVTVPLPRVAERPSEIVTGKGSERKTSDEPAPQLAFFVARGTTSADDDDGGSEFGDADGDADAAALAALASPGDPTRTGPWQLHDSYILVPTRQGLLVIDQHSAHERILFEETMERFQGQGGTSQRLLFPLTLRLSPAEQTAVAELSGLLRAAGFELEEFGDRTVIVHAVPNLHERFDAETCFREMVSELAHGSELVNSARNQHERIAKSLACKGAIKAGQPLSRLEMEELVDRLFATDLPGHDVHGRPTILRLTLDELARRFGRT
ncbi:MAG: DNA mismatch repair endonuclease MutL [Gemmatimonadetes bacterium]|nr:DNA mismatch repair endonuclease MutL [Gemmatimonadota bacterium]